MNFDELSQPEFLEFQDRARAEMAAIKPSVNYNKEEKITTFNGIRNRPSATIFPGTCYTCVFSTARCSIHSTANLQLNLTEKMELNDK